MKIIVEVDDNNSCIQPYDWKKLDKARKDINAYIKLRGYRGKINFQLDSLGGDLYVTLFESDVFSSVDSLVKELNRSIPGFIFEAEED